MTDLGFLDSTRAAYDAVATGYSALFVDQLDREPVLRSMLVMPDRERAAALGRIRAFLACRPEPRSASSRYRC